jgi:WD40 repeat protein
MDGKTLFSAGDDCVLREWNTDTGAVALQARVHAFSCAVLTSQAITQALRSLAGHVLAVRALALSPDGRTLFSAGDDKTVRVWSVPAGKVRWGVGPCV